MANRKRLRYLRAIDENLEGKPDSALVDYLRIPEKFVSPGRRIARRLLYATAALFAAVFIVAVFSGLPCLFGPSLNRAMHGPQLFSDVMC